MIHFFGSDLRVPTLFIRQGISCVDSKPRDVIIINGSSLGDRPALFLFDVATRHNEVSNKKSAGRKVRAAQSVTVANGDRGRP